MGWETAPGFEALLEPVLDSDGELVKQSFRTVVTRHRVAGRVFYVKRYRHAVRPLAPMKYFFRLPKSHREWIHAAQLQERQVPVVPHWAHGERWAWCGLLESALITEGPGGYSSLAEAKDLESAVLQRALGNFVRQLHDHGVVHADFHPYNLLTSEGTLAFCLVDIDKIQFRAALDGPERLANLAMLQAWTPLTPSFYDGYGALSEQAGEIARLGAAVRRRYHASWARRCLRHAHEIESVHAGKVRWLVRGAARTKRLNEILARPDANRAALDYLVERYALSFNGARRAYRRAYHQELSGVPGPRPVAVGERRLLGLCLCDYFVADRSPELRHNGDGSR